MTAELRLNKPVHLRSAEWNPAHEEGSWLGAPDAFNRTEQARVM